MRIGLVGAGRIGAVHARTLADDPRVDELVITDVDQEQAARGASAAGARVAADLEALIALRPDAVAIASPTDTHADIVLRCCALGIPTFCEKPVFRELSVGERVATEVRLSGIPVQVGFQRRFDTGFGNGREALRSGALGQLRRVHMVTADPQPPPFDYVAVSGGIHRDCQIHDFDALRWVSGREVVEAFAAGARRGAEYFGDVGDVDETVVLLTLDDCSLATLQASRYNGHGYDVRMDLAGTSASISVGLDARVPLRSVEPDGPVPAAQPWSSFMDRFATAYRVEMEAFVTMVSTGGPSPCTLDDALAALRIAEAVTQSRLRRRPVALEHATLTAPGAR